jgi:long-chain acyl-CoA synthetase
VDNLADLIFRAADRAPGRTALIDGDRQLTWAELAGRVERTAAGLANLGLQPGDRIGLQLGNTLDYPIAFFAALTAGLTVVPINPAYTEPELTAVLEDSRAAALITSSVTAIQNAKVRPLIVTGRQVPDGAIALPEAEPGEHRHTDPAALIYTSGTSGRPRGAMLSHRALLANIDQCSRIEPPVMRPDDVVLLCLPLFHVYGLGPGLGMIARHAATGVLAEPTKALAEMEKHRVTSVIGVPTLYAGWLAEPGAAKAFGSVRLAMSGAAALPPEIHDRLKELTTLELQQGYGMTETAPVLTCTVGYPTKPGSIGRAVPGVELWLRDEDGEPAEDGDPGEIVVRGENLFDGYWPDAAGGPDSAGWFGTGDVAYADADGDLHLVDRRRELIIVGGFNVYPAEVETVLLEHPAVAEAAVVGVPGAIKGEAVKAYVVAKTVVPSGSAPQAPLRTVEPADLIAWCARSLARFKCPTEVEIVDELPHSATGKIRKAGLRVRPERRVTLLSRVDCHLCDVARADLRRITAELGVALSEVDVDTDAELRAEYGDRLPVILIDGVEHGYWRVEEERLRRALGS